MSEKRVRVLRSTLLLALDIDGRTQIVEVPVERESVEVVGEALAEGIRLRLTLRGGQIERAVRKLVGHMAGAVRG